MDFFLSYSFSIPKNSKLMLIILFFTENGKSAISFKKFQKAKCELKALKTNFKNFSRKFRFYLKNYFTSTLETTFKHKKSRS